MYKSRFGLIIGFQGCDLKFRDDVINNRTIFNPSNNNYDWLGSGMYFWENNKQRALSFSNELKDVKRGQSGKINNPAVLGAVIDLGYCLDLLDEEFIVMIKNSYLMLEQYYKPLNIQLPENKPIKNSTDLLLRNLDCAVIENLHKERIINNLRQFDSVRGAFFEGRSLYPNAGFNEKNHIQICVRNSNCIKGFFIPREESNSFIVP